MCYLLLPDEGLRVSLMFVGRFIVTKPTQRHTGVVVSSFIWLRSLLINVFTANKHIKHTAHIRHMLNNSPEIVLWSWCLSVWSDVSAVLLFHIDLNHHFESKMYVRRKVNFRQPSASYFGRIIKHIVASLTFDSCTSCSSAKIWYIWRSRPEYTDATSPSNFPAVEVTPRR